MAKEIPFWRWILTVSWLTIVVHIVSELDIGQKCTVKPIDHALLAGKTNHNLFDVEPVIPELGDKDPLPCPSRRGLFGIMFADAGKKKKKEKSEVVVISVNNPSKGHGGMYPVFIPSCGGHGGMGYGRRKRSIQNGSQSSRRYQSFSRRR